MKIEIDSQGIFTTSLERKHLTQDEYQEWLLAHMAWVEWRNRCQEVATNSKSESKTKK